MVNKKRNGFCLAGISNERKTDLFCMNLEIKR